MPKRSILGPHPGVVGIGYDGREVDVPNFKQGPRPSNIINAPEMIDGTGVGDLYCEATSLSQDTGLSGRIGINFEIGPPGTRSSGKVGKGMWCTYFDSLSRCSCS